MRVSHWSGDLAVVAGLLELRPPLTTAGRRHHKYPTEGADTEHVGRYLLQPAAVQLTKNLFELLNSAGRLLVGNFAHGYHTQAYMECMMDWRLITRGEDEMFDLLSQIPAVDVAKRAVYCDDVGGYILYIDATKA